MNHRIHFFVALLIAALAVTRAEAQYTFTKLLDSQTSGFSLNPDFGASMVLNNNGHVLLAAYDDSFDRRQLVRTDGISTKVVGPSSLLGFDTYNMQFDMNDAGMVVFTTTDSSERRTTVLSTADGVHFSTYLKAPTQFDPNFGENQPVFEFDALHLANDGSMTFLYHDDDFEIVGDIHRFKPFGNGPVTVPSGSNAILTPQGVVEHVFGSKNSPITNVTAMGVNGAGQTAAGGYDSYTDRQTILGVGDGGSFKIIAEGVNLDTDPDFGTRVIPYNNSGQSAVVREDFDLGGQELIITDGTTTQIVAATSFAGPPPVRFQSFSSRTIGLNDDGDAVFYADFVDETQGPDPVYRWGIFDGADPDADFVIRTGDILNNQIVRNVATDGRAFNNLGQVAFLVTLENPINMNITHALYLATPVGGGASEGDAQTPEPTTLGLLTVGALAMWRRRRAA